MKGSNNMKDKDEVNELYKLVQKASIEKKERQENSDKIMARKCVEENYDFFCKRIRKGGLEYGLFEITIPFDEWRRNYFTIRDCYIIEALKEKFGIFKPDISSRGLTFSWKKEEKVQLDYHSY